jgi:TRAP-type C4-dicarboxylate transport system permease small subunit
MELSDEVGGYIIVAVAFLSLSVCQTGRSYHHVEIVLSRLSKRRRTALLLLFDLLSLAFAGVMVWQLGRLELRSLVSGDTAPTVLATPIWVPQSVMVAGMLAVSWSLLRSAYWHLRDLRRRS